MASMLIAVKDDDGWDDGLPNDVFEAWPLYEPSKLPCMYVYANRYP